MNPQLYKSKDETLFCARLWNLMQEKNLPSPGALAKAMYLAGIVPVESSTGEESSIIGSMTRRIQDHLDWTDTDKLPGRYVNAYCQFFDCSPDYLFGTTTLKSRNYDVRKFCEVTKLSEAAVKNLIEGTPELPGHSDYEHILISFWSKVLESNLFYGMPYEFHEYCLEIGQLRSAEKQINTFKTLSKDIDTSEKYASALTNMMTDNYRKLAGPHEAASFMHLNIILMNFMEYLEKWGNEFYPEHEQYLHDLLVKDIMDAHQKSHDAFIKKMGMSDNQEDNPN